MERVIKKSASTVAESDSGVHVSYQLTHVRRNADPRLNDVVKF